MPKKTKYPFIHFVFEPDFRLGKRGFWFCYNNKTNELLFVVTFYRRWKEWVVAEVADGVVLSAECLLNAADFLRQLNEEE